jgi:hypothetical protein
MTLKYFPANFEFRGEILDSPRAHAESGANCHHFFKLFLAIRRRGILPKVTVATRCWPRFMRLSPEVALRIGWGQISTQTMTKYSRLAIAAAAVASTMTCTRTPVLAQSADALIDKNMDKGILTVREANDLREEADKNFTTAYSVKSRMPEWVKAFKERSCAAKNVVLEAIFGWIVSWRSHGRPQDRTINYVMCSIDMVRFGLLKGRQMCLAALLVFDFSLCAVQAKGGATVPWTTYEAEAMTVNGGTILGPPPRAVDKNVTITNTVEAESSGRQCVKLSGMGQYMEFTVQAAANTLVVRYSVPDTADGTGADYTISLYTNGILARKIPVTSKYSWLYGAYTFSNVPGDGSPRDYYDEARLMNLSIGTGDHVRLQVDADDSASYYVIDLVDLENIAPALMQPTGSKSVLSYGAVGNGTNDDTVAIQNCVAGGGVIWFPAGNYMVTNDIHVPAGTTIQGAGMWRTTFIGNPATYANQYGRVRFDGAGSNIHFADFAILGKLNYRNDSEANDGFSEFFGANSTMTRVWVEHTKTGAWIANSQGMIFSDCRFRDTIADGINLCVGCNSCIVTNCTARNTGDDSFPIWPATYTPAVYTAGSNVITHCTAQSPFFANGGAIYGGIDNRIEDCLFQDIPDGAGILIAGTFPIGTNTFRGTTVVQRCDLNRCGGNDPGWRWRGALTLCPDGNTIDGLQINNLNISNSLSYAIQILHNTLSNATMSDINVRTYAVGVPPYHPQDPYPNNNDYCDGVFGVFADSSANGSISVSDLSINGTNFIAVQTNAYLTDCVDKSGGFAFNFLTLPVTVTVQASPAGHSFTVDGTNYSTAQPFNWTQGSVHTIVTTSPQNIGAGMQDAWSSWSDGGAISHIITPLVNTNYTANFTTQYYLTMNAGAGGSVSPGSGWNNSGASVNISATPSLGYNFAGWTGNGSGSYSGNNNSASIAMNGPITQSASFISPQVQELAFVQQPGNVLQGATLAPEVQVQAFDNNKQPLGNAAITLSLGSGTGNLTGTLTRLTDGSGIAHFNDLSLNQAGPKTLTASALSGSAPSTNSNSFMVIGPVAALAFTTQPGSAVAGIPFGQQPVLKTVDAFGSPTTTGLPASLIVSVVLTNGNGILSGMTIYNLGTSGSNGVATFSNLSIDAAGSGNQLAVSTAVQTGNPVSGAVLWLDASDANTLTTNATRVQAWKNKGSGGAAASGTNLWFTQNTTTLQPWLTNKLNGRSVVTFNKNGNGYGAGCTFLGNIGKNSYTNNGNQMTYFVVARQEETSFGWQAPVSFSMSGQIDGQGSAGVVVLTDGSQSAPYPLGIQRKHLTTPMQADVAVPAANAAFELTFVDNAGAANLYLTESGGFSRSNSVSIVNGISPYKYGIMDVTVGARLEPSPSTVDNGWDGDVAEVLTYNTALNDADRALVEAYLTNKWFVNDGGLSLASARSDPFIVQFSGSQGPPAQKVLGVRFNSDGSVTLTYAITPQFHYHMETTTNLFPASWTKVADSETNPTEGTVEFTDPGPFGSDQRYYRSVSP